MKLPDFDDNDYRVLEVIDARGVIRGSRLRREAGIKDAEALRKTLRKLTAEGLVGISGNLSDNRNMQQAFFSPVPSTRGLLKQAVRQHDTD